MHPSSPGLTPHCQQHTYHLVVDGGGCRVVVRIHSRRDGPSVTQIVVLRREETPHPKPETRESTGKGRPRPCSKVRPCSGAHSSKSGTEHIAHGGSEVPTPIHPLLSCSIPPGSLQRRSSHDGTTTTFCRMARGDLKPSAAASHRLGGILRARCAWGQVMLQHPYPDVPGEGSPPTL